MSYPRYFRHGALLEEIDDEIVRAQKLHAPMANAHEAYAVILEELDEYKDWVWTKQSNRDIAAMRKELIQLAAMAIRTILDTIDEIPSTFARDGEV